MKTDCGEIGAHCAVKRSVVHCIAVQCQTVLSDGISGEFAWYIAREWGQLSQNRAEMRKGPCLRLLAVMCAFCVISWCWCVGSDGCADCGSSDVDEVVDAVMSAGKFER